MRQGWEKRKRFRRQQFENCNFVAIQSIHDAAPTESVRIDLRLGIRLKSGVYVTLLPPVCVSFTSDSTNAFEKVGMANFVRSATIILMGSTVMAAGVLVVLYS
jgi:hypothetical protein